MSVPSGTVTFVFSDIEGSTRLLHELGDDYREVLAAQRRLLRDAFGGHGGTEVDSQGDALFFSFRRARDAAAGAADAQRALAEHSWPDGATVRVRMGLHTGEPSIGEEGYVGLDVHRAARICSAAHGGQVLLSETTRALLGAHLPAGLTVRDLGPQRLKNIEQPERLFQLVVDGVGSDFPAPRTERASSADVLAERIDSYVEDTLAKAFAGELPVTVTKPRLLGLTAVGLGALFLVVLFGVLVVLLLRGVF